MYLAANAAGSAPAKKAAAEGEPTTIPTLRVSMREKVWDRGESHNTYT